MRPHGRISINPTRPAAQAVCDRCGFNYPHASLAWQFQWQGTRLQNLRLLVCPKCMDIPQEGLRTFTLPPDPVPIENPRQENYVNADNPLSYLGFDPSNLFLPISQRGQNIGNMTLNGGVDAAFNGSANKPFAQCAALVNSILGFQNIVGKNWAADPSGVTMTLPSTTSIQTHIVSSFTLTAPNDKPFLSTGPTGYLFQGSSNNATWTTLLSGTTAGTKGEVVTVTSVLGAAYQYHRIALQGDGISNIGVAQLVINVFDGVNSEV